MTWHRTISGAAIILSVWGLAFTHAQSTPQSSDQSAVTDNAARLLDEGRRVFRYETFGDEAYWGDTLKLHRAIAGEKHGGVGPGVSPKTALSVGLKVDVDAVP